MPFTLTLGVTGIGLSQVDSGDIPFTIERLGGFAGDVVVSVPNLPTDVTVAPVTLGPTETSGGLVMVAGVNSVAPDVFTAEVTAEGGSYTATASVDVNLELPPSVELVPLPAEVRVPVGTSTQLAVSFTRDATHQNSSVLLELSGLPAGVTASPTQRTVGSPDTTGFFQLTAAGNAVVDTVATTTLTYRVFNGPASTATFDVRVVAAPSFTASPDVMVVTVDQDGTGTAALNVTRDNGFTEALDVSQLASFPELSLDALQIGGTETSGVLTFRAAADARLDRAYRFPIEVRSTSSTRTVELDVRVRPIQSDLDGTFAFHGARVAASPSGGFEGYTHVRCDGAGLCVVAAAFGRLVRYTAAGDLDTTWGGIGAVEVTSNGNQVYVDDLTLQADGMLAILGNYTTAGVTHVVVARYDATGMPDGTFGTGGVLDFTVNSARAYPATIQYRAANTRYFVTGSANGATNVDVFVARITGTGALDTTWGGGDGIITDDLGAEDYAITSTALGGVVVAGARYVNGPGVSFIARYKVADGTRDTAFGTNGVVEFAPGTCPSQVARLMDDGTNLFALGNGGGGCTAVSKFSSTGVLDTTYGTGGHADTSFGVTGTIDSRVLVLHPDGATVAGNYDGTFKVARLAATGALDTTWGTGGIMDMAFAPADSERAADGWPSVNGTVQLVGSGSHGFGVMARVVP